MKKILIVMLLAVFTATAQGQQVNPRLTQLDEFFRQQGYTIRSSQQNWGSGVQFHTGINHIQLCEMIEEDRSPESLSRAKKREEKRQLLLDSVRTIFAKLGKESTESYMYEYHKDGKDTIKYSYKKSFPDKSREIASFKFNWIPRKSEESEKIMYLDGEIMYSHFTVIPTGIAREDMITFDGEAFQAHIQPVMNKFMQLKGAKAYPVHWQHDEGFDKDDDFEGWDHHKKHAGISTGTHYYIPSEHKDVVQTLFEELISLSHDYVNKHPEQFYWIELEPTIPGSTSSHSIGGLPLIVKGENNKGEDVYYLNCKFEDNAYHIFSYTVQGVCWIPREWASLKSYINGKKVYIKGMEPKKDKKK
ncbi:MAG: hypothetical protein IJ826_08220 [Bacteroidaceae bacterium]|nr:hypothetical protein [Bacteroidaceae bacterium]